MINHKKFSNPPRQLSKTETEFHYQIPKILTVHIWVTWQVFNHTPKTFNAVPFQCQIILLVAISLLKEVLQTFSQMMHVIIMGNLFIALLNCTNVPSLWAPTGLSLLGSSPRECWPSFTFLIYNTVPRGISDHFIGEDVWLSHIQNECWPALHNAISWCTKFWK